MLTKTRLYTRIGIGICVNLALGFTSFAVDEPASPSLDDTSWQLVSISHSPIPVDARMISGTLGFNQPPGAMSSGQIQGTKMSMFLFGNAACGAFGGTAVENGSLLKISGLSPDPIKCSSFEKSSEHYYLKALAQAKSFVIDPSGYLVITESNGVTQLVFSPIK